jgi:hypothetical protein
MTRCVWLGPVAIVLLVAAGARAQMPPSGAAMPDPKSMSGMPLPSGDTAPGTVVIRVVRGALDNVIPNQPVDLIGGSSPVTLKTDESGRATFSGLTPGTRVKGVTVVNGERLETQEFAVPAQGGMRVLLVATDPDLEKRAAEDKKLAQMPAQAGIVVLGNESRFVFEIGDDGLNVFSILHIVNTARTPVQPQTPVVFDIPDEAEHPSLLEGSSPQAALAGKRLTVNGPFAPGPTVVQLAYTLPISSDSLTLRQPLPLALNQLSVMVQKVGPMHITSEQIASHGDMPAEGQAYIVGQGPALKAGDTLTITFTGLPHAATWPRNVAIALAVIILIGGAFAATRPGPATAAEAARRKKLQTKRDRLFTELTALEQDQRRGAVDRDRYAARRRELVTSLERVYAELDEQAAA